jgi:hypothetical protein
MVVINVCSLTLHVLGEEIVLATNTRLIEDYLWNCTIRITAIYGPC